MEEPTDERSRVEARQVCHKLGSLAAMHNVTHEAIAEKTGMKRPSVSRLFSGRFAPRLDLVILILNAINDLSGKHFTLKDIDCHE